MDNAKIKEKISKIVEKLETLKTRKKRYSNAHFKCRWDREDDLRNSLWTRSVQPLVDEIGYDLEELWDYILMNTEWNKGGIKNAIESRRHDDINRIDRLIHELSLIQKRLEIKSQQYQEPAETEQSKPLGKFECLRVWLWKLYDATVKSAFEWLWTKIFSGPT